MYHNVSMGRKMGINRLVMPTCLVALLLCTVAVKAAPLDDFNIYYINGIDNDPLEVLNSTRVLKEQLARYSNITFANVDVLYNQSEGFGRDVVETARQAELQGARDFYTRLWSIMRGNMSASDAIATDPVVQKIVSSFDEKSFVLTPDLARMIGKVEIFSTPPNAPRRKKTILVAHSQGNFFANQIVNGLIAKNSDLVGCIGIVGVATPATFVAGTPAGTVNSVPVTAVSGTYLTRPDDVAINLIARTSFAGGAFILPATSTLVVPPGIASTDPAHHNFVASYMLPFGNRVVTEIETVANQINANGANCNPPPPTACGAPIHSAGSSGTSPFILAIGQGTQSVTANFEAYSIPDGLVLSANGVNLASTNGLVGGYHSYTFTFDSSKLGTTNLLATVTGNADTNTLWKLCLDCNNLAGSTCGPSFQSRSVNMTMNFDTVANTWLCTTGNMTLDGQAIGNLDSPPGNTIKTVSLTPTLGAETHTLSAPLAGCTCLNRLGCIGFGPNPKFQITYKDGAGTPVLLTAPLTKQFKFVIQ
ncbi:MAG: hypothetical protein HY080_07310 [Gammaproteobacteria bacterium]|nr:hypothetical protein [Gammaproteobacteria bacterium]